jgi:acetylxylan esterase
MTSMYAARTIGVAAALALAATLAPAPASALQVSAPTGQLRQVTDFGPNPTGVGMHLYVPSRVGHRPPVLTVLHYCTGTGPIMFEITDYASLADRYGFIVIYPTAGRADGCFDVTSPQALLRDGGSDPVGIVSMVRYAREHFHADSRRSYAVGFSSGAEMVNVLLAAYPDVFAAGSVMAGSPVGCYTADDGGFNPNCENGGTVRSPQRWGEFVRAAYPGYTGPRPPVQLWHGTADEVISYTNFGEEIKQWTNVLRAGPSRTDQPRPTWTRGRYAGRIALETYSVDGGAHGIAFSEADIELYALGFFGLAKRYR